MIAFTVIAASELCCSTEIQNLHKKQFAPVLANPVNLDSVARITTLKIFLLVSICAASIKLSDLNRQKPKTEVKPRNFFLISFCLLLKNFSLLFGLNIQRPLTIDDVSLC